MEQRNKEAGKYNKPFPAHLRKLMGERNITQNELAQIVGKTRQTVAQYVSGISEPGYDTLVIIAKHFNVPIDYLLGKTEDYSNAPSAVDELGLSTEAVEWIKKIKDISFLYEDSDNRIAFLSQILENSDFQLFFHYLCEFSYACNAEKIYDILFDKISPANDGEFISDKHIDAFNRHLTKMIECSDVSPKIRDYLSAKIEAVNGTVDSNSWIVNALEGVDGFSISDIPELRVKRSFSLLMESIREDAKYQKVADIFSDELVVKMKKDIYNGNNNP